MGATSLDLSQIKTDVLSAASTFRTLIGLGNVNNTADLDKPISTATQEALDAKVNLAGDTMTGTLTAPEYRSPRAGSLSHVSPQNNIVLYGGFTGYGIGFDNNGELGTIINSTLRSKLGQHLGLGSAGQVRFNSSADTSGSWDTLILRNATGPSLEARSGGFRIRTLDGSAAAGLDCGAITASGAIATSGSIGIGGVSALGASHPINLPVYTWINWAGAAYLTTDPGIGLRLNNCAIQNLTYLGFGSSNTTVVTFDANDTLAQRRSTNSQVWRLYNTFTDASNYIRQALSFTTYSGTVYAQHIVEGAGTGAVNIPLVITPRGTGAFILGPMPDGTVTGGNARGAYAVDLQLDRGAANQVASGDYSFIVASKRARATGDCSVVFASNTTNSVVVSGKNSVAFAQGDSGGASGTCAVAFGDFGGYGGAFASGFSSLGACGGRASNTYAKAFGGGTSASRFGQTSFANGYFANLADSQYSIFVARNKTTNNTTTTLFLNGSSERITIPSGSLFLFTAKIVGVRSDGLQRASYMRKGTIINVAGSTSLVGVIETIGTDVEDNPALDMTITADDANDALAITVTGITGETWRWVAVVDGVEVAYGT